VGWLQQIWSVLIASAPDPHLNARWQQEKAWYDSYKPLDDEHKYGDVLQYAEKRYAEIVEADRKIDLKAEWLFGVAFAATGGCAAAIISSHVSLWWSLPTLALLAASMLTAIRVRLPNQREVPASIRDAISIDENENRPEAIIAANMHLASAANVVTSAWKSNALLAATKLLFMATALFLIPLLRMSVNPPADHNPQKSFEFRDGRILLDLNLAAEKSSSGGPPPPRAPGPERLGPAE
jgi:hypothetical protein